MGINPEITKKLASTNLDVDKALLYLLALYHNTNYDYMDKAMMSAVNSLSIFSLDGNEIVWNIPLYSNGTVTKSQWDWVISEYRQLFKDVNPERAGDKQACLKRMKNFFADYPNYRKEDVIRAVKAYITSVQSPQFVKSADKFILEGRGHSAKSTLLTWLEIIEDSRDNTETWVHGKVM